MGSLWFNCELWLATTVRIFPADYFTDHNINLANPAITSTLPPQNQLKLEKQINKWSQNWLKTYGLEFPGHPFHSQRAKWWRVKIRTTICRYSVQSLGTHLATGSSTMIKSEGGDLCVGMSCHPYYCWWLGGTNMVGAEEED